MKQKEGHSWGKEKEEIIRKKKGTITCGFFPPKSHEERMWIYLVCFLEWSWEKINSIRPVIPNHINLFYSLVLNVHPFDWFMFEMFL